MRFSRLFTLYNRPGVGGTGCIPVMEFLGEGGALAQNFQPSDKKLSLHRCELMKKNTASENSEILKSAIPLKQMKSKTDHIDNNLSYGTAVFSVILKSATEPPIQSIQIEIRNVIIKHDCLFEPFDLDDRCRLFG